MTKKIGNWQNMEIINVQENKEKLVTFLVTKLLYMGILYLVQILLILCAILSIQIVILIG